MEEFREKVLRDVRQVIEEELGGAGTRTGRGLCLGLGPSASSSRIQMKKSNTVAQHIKNFASSDELLAPRQNLKFTKMATDARGEDKSPSAKEL